MWQPYSLRNNFWCQSITNLFVRLRIRSANFFLPSTHHREPSFTMQCINKKCGTKQKRSKNAFYSLFLTSNKRKDVDLQLLCFFFFCFRYAHNTFFLRCCYSLLRLSIIFSYLCVYFYQTIIIRSQQIEYSSWSKTICSRKYDTTLVVLKCLLISSQQYLKDILYS